MTGIVTVVWICEKCGVIENPEMQLISPFEELDIDMLAPKNHEQWDYIYDPDTPCFNELYVCPNCAKKYKEWAG